LYFNNFFDSFANLRLSLAVSARIDTSFFIANLHALNGNRSIGDFASLMIMAGKKADLPLGLLGSSSKIKQTALGKK
jgi:hypothetical protein